MRIVPGSERTGAAVRRSTARPRIASRTDVHSVTSRSDRRSAASGACDGPGGRLCGQAEWGRLVGRLNREDHALVAQAIGRVGLAAFADTPIRRSPAGCSSGRSSPSALAGQPSLLVLDELTTGVDVESQESLAALLATLHRELGARSPTSRTSSGPWSITSSDLSSSVGRSCSTAPDDLPGVWHDPGHVHARE